MDGWMDGWMKKGKEEGTEEQLLTAFFKMVFKSCLFQEASQDFHLYHIDPRITSFYYNPNRKMSSSSPKLRWRTDPYTLLWSLTHSALPSPYLTSNNDLFQRHHAFPKSRL
jgi:hypothetical protein